MEVDRGYRRYFAPDGSPLTLGEWCELFEKRAEDTARESWWRKSTQISEDVEVSTVWLGANHALLPGVPPLFWETMIFGGEHSDEQWRYSSREAALDDHERIVRALRAGHDPVAETTERLDV